MSYSTCVTCGRLVRDLDEQLDRMPTHLPDHGCADPRGEDPWNDGQHIWDPLRGDWVPLGTPLWQLIEPVR